MKKYFTYPIILLVWFGHPEVTFPQGWDCLTPDCQEIKNQWSINVNAGFASYFGDISVYDKNPIKKIEHESEGGYGFIITRYFKNKVGISGQFLVGNMKASMDDNSFQSRVMEYNIHCRLNLLKIVPLNINDRFGAEFYLGIGQFFFETTNVNSLALINDNSKYQPDKPEFVYFFGGGISYRLSTIFTTTADLALRQCQTDRLENIVMHNDFDYYSYLSLGVTLNVNKLLKIKNKH